MHAHVYIHTRIHTHTHTHIHTYMHVYREVYALLLQECSDEQRFQITSKLCEEILGAVVDGAMDLTTCANVLGDALHILGSKEIKLSSTQRNTSNADDGLDGADLNDPAANMQAVAKRNMLDKIVKGNVMQNVVPTLAALKSVLEAAHSPLLGPMMTCLAQVCIYMCVCVCVRIYIYLYIYGIIVFG